MVFTSSDVIKLFYVNAYDFFKKYGGDRNYPPSPIEITRKVIEIERHNLLGFSLTFKICRMFRWLPNMEIIIRAIFSYIFRSLTMALPAPKCQSGQRRPKVIEIWRLDPIVPKILNTVTWLCYVLVCVSHLANYLHNPDCWDHKLDLYMDS